MRAQDKQGMKTRDEGQVLVIDMGQEGKGVSVDVWQGRNGSSVMLFSSYEIVTLKLL